MLRLCNKIKYHNTFDQISQTLISMAATLTIEHLLHAFCTMRLSDTLLRQTVLHLKSSRGLNSAETVLKAVYANDPHHLLASCGSCVNLHINEVLVI